MASLLYIVGLVVFVSGVGWLLSSLGVATAIVNVGALALLAAGALAGLTIRAGQRS
jgi:hypothetical protein